MLEPHPVVDKPGLLLSQGRQSPHARNYYRQSQHKQQFNMQIQPVVFQWLHEAGLLKGGTRTPRNTMLLSQDISDLLANGFFFGKVAKLLAAKQLNSKELLAGVDSLKEISSAAIRIYNWKIVTEVFGRMGFSITKEDREAALAGEAIAPPKILHEIFKKYVQPSFKRKAKKQESLQLKVEEISGSSNPAEAKNAFEFMTILLVKNLGMTAEQVLSLYPDNNKYLSHLVIKGSKSSFVQVLAFFKEVEVLRSYLVTITENSPSAVKLALNIVKLGVVSRSQQVAATATSIFAGLFIQFETLAKAALLTDWMKGQGISTFIVALKKHKLLSPALVGVLVQYLGQPFQLVAQKMKQLATEPADSINTLDAVLWGSAGCKAVLEESSAFPQWIKQLLKSMDGDASPAVKRVALGCYFDLWQNYFKQLQGAGELEGSITLVAKLASSYDRLLRVEAVLLLLSLVGIESQRRSRFGPVIYSAVVGVYLIAVEQHREDEQELILTGLLSLIKEVDRLPCGKVVERILGKGITLHAEIQFLQSLISLGKVNVFQELQMLEKLGTQLMEELSFADLLLPLLKTVCGNKAGFPRARCTEVQFKVLKVGLAHLFSISKASRNLSQIQSAFDESKGKPTESLVKQILRLQRVVYITEFLVALLEGEKEEALPILVVSSYTMTLRETGRHSLALKKVLALFGDAENIIQAALLKEEDERVQESLKSPLPEPSEDEDKPTPESLILRESIVSEQKSESNKPTFLALKGILETKRRREALLKKKQEEKTRKEQKLEEEKELVRKLLNRRHVELQHESKLTGELQYQYQLDSVQENNYDALGLAELKLFELQKEEDHLEESLRFVSSKYRKVFRLIFNTYSMTGYRITDAVETSKSNAITLAELLRLLKEFGLDLKVRKEEVKSLVKQILARAGSTSPALQLEFPLFVQFVEQFAIAYFWSDFRGQAQKHLLPSECLEQLIDLFKRKFLKDGKSFEVFNDPESAYFSETEVIRELNRRLQEDTNYELPTGYKRVSSVKVEFLHRVNDNVAEALPEGYAVCSGLVDDLLGEAIGSRFMEYAPQRRVTVRARPIAFTEQKTAQRMPSQQGRKRLVIAPESHPLVHFSLGIKIGLAAIPYRFKYIGEEVAYVLDAIVSAVENGQERIEKKAIDNSYFRLRRERQQNATDLERKKQQLRKLRQSSIIPEVKKFEEERSSRLKSVRKAQRQKIIQARKQEMEAKLKKQKQWLEAKEHMEERRRIHSEKLKATPEPATYKKKTRKEIIEELAEMHSVFKSKQEAKVKKEEELKLKRKQLQQKLKAQYHQQSKEEQQLKAQLKEDYNALFKGPQCKNIIKAYQGRLKMLWQNLLLQEKRAISGTSNDQISQQTLNFFLTKFLVYPHFLGKDTLYQSFNILVRENQAILLHHEKGQSLVVGLDYQRFIQFLFRIAIVSKSTLLELRQKAGRGRAIEEGKEQTEKQDPPTSPEKGKKGKPLIGYDTRGFSLDCFQQLLIYLRLEKDKVKFDQRFRAAIDSKSKPTDVAWKQIVSSYGTDS